VKPNARIAETWEPSPGDPLGAQARKRRHELLRAKAKDGHSGKGYRRMGPCPPVPSMLAQGGRMGDAFCAGCRTPSASEWLDVNCVAISNDAGLRLLE